MERLATLAQGKDHLGLTTPPGHVDDAKLQDQLDAAQLWVLDYVGRTAAGVALTEAWVDPTTTPANIRHAALLMFGEFWRFRGDDPEGAGPERWPEADAPPAVLGLLRRYGGPVLV